MRSIAEPCGARQSPQKRSPRFGEPWVSANLPPAIPQEVSIEDRRAAGQGRWVEARDLEEGDVLKKRGGDVLIVTGLTSLQQTCRVYCLEVEQYHNCAIHFLGILAHNGGKREAAATGGKMELAKQLVTVYGTVTLEHFELSILGAADASALLDWLRKNGYQVNPEAREVLASYIDRNWAFVAVKLNPGEKRQYKNEFLPPPYEIGGNKLKMRYLTEDVPYGLVPLSGLGKMFNVSTPTIDAIIHLASLINQTDYMKVGRTVEKLGIARLNVEQLHKFVNKGNI